MEDAEIIKAVAEKVMGWEKKDSDIDAFWSHPEYGARYYLRDWNPLTNANYWMMVVERMRSLGWDTSIELSAGTDFVTVIFSIPGQWPEGNYGSQNKIGRAVCLAALKAVEGE